jgi:hypothetical protein
MSTITDDELVRFFCTHFVSLGVEFCPVDSKGAFVRDSGVKGNARKNDIVCASGFVMEAKGHWFLVTAGHVLEGIEKIVEAGEEGILQSHLIDFFGPETTHRTLVPIQYRDIPKYYEYDDARGTDFGILHLRELFRLNLRKNGIVPVDRRMWASDATSDCDCYFMIGLPTELMKRPSIDRIPGTGASLDLRVALIPVYKSNDDSSGLRSRHKPMFVGTIPPEHAGVVDIKGMSGGPIMGVRRLPDGSGIYAVVAIQSAWLPSTRTIYAQPFPPLARQIELAIENKLLNDIDATAAKSDG